MPHPRPGTAVTGGRGCHGQMPTGHESSSRAARADGRDAQNRKIWRKAASHADPRTTMRYDRARGSLDRHATYIVAAYIAGAAR